MPQTATLEKPPIAAEKPQGKPRVEQPKPLGQAEREITDRISKDGEPDQVFRDVAGEKPKENVLIRGKEVLAPSGAVIYKGEGFEHLFERDDITLTGRIATRTEQGEGKKTYEAITIGEMGREAGWEMQFANTANGHRFNFLGIKGIGLTQAGRRFLEAVRRPKTMAQAISGTAPKVTDSYEMTDSPMILPKEGAEERAVLGLVGEEEILNDIANASRLASEGVWTAESVAAVVENTDRPEVAEAKRRDLIKPETKEAREVRAYRSPERLNKLHLMLKELGRFGGGDKNLKQNIKQFMQRGIQYLKNINISLESYPGTNEVERFVSWSFEKAGEQAGILSRIGFRHDNLKDFQNFTSLLEIVDLGEQTEWVGEYIRPENYFELYAEAVSLYAAGAIVNGHQPNLETAANSYVKGFMNTYAQSPENKRRAQQFINEEDPLIGPVYLAPEVHVVTHDVSMLNLSGWNNLSLGPLPEVKSGRIIEWPEGKPVIIRTYSQLMRYHIGNALRTEVAKLVGSETKTKLAT